MNKKVIKIVSILTVFALVITIFGFSAPFVPTADAATRLITGVNPAKAVVPVDWNVRYHYADLEQQLQDLNKAFPEFSDLEPIGKTYQDRDLWCMTITDKAYVDENKSKVTIFGNIHGGEGESAACAMYTAWYLLENSKNIQVADLLKKYIIYVIPLINPDGYEQSFLYRTRENADPAVAPDRDGDGIKFNDNYEDINGDGMVGTVYSLDIENNKTTGTIGGESKDGNGNGKLGDDPVNSGVDLNRNFDFLWGQDGAMDTEGPSAASELETQAVQKFVDSHSDMKGLITLHTGIQTTLYPWGYRDVNKDDPEELADNEFMKATAIEMSKAMSQSTRRNFYAKQSFFDYQTYSELIDYAYGLYGIHSYTIEVYNGGTYNRNGVTSAYDKNFEIYDPNGDDSNVPNLCKWNNTLPASVSVDYTHEEAVAMFEAAGIDYTKLISTQRSGWGSSATVTENPWGENEGIRITYNSTQQMCGKAPEDQDQMVTGVMEGILTMMDSEEPDKAPVTVAEKEKAEAEAKAKAKAKAKTVKGFKVTCSKQKFTIKWKKTSGVTGYQIQYRIKGAAKYKVLKTTKSLKYTTKKFKKGKYYQFKMRTYTLINGKKVYGKFTAVKKVKCKA